MTLVDDEEFGSDVPEYVKQRKSQKKLNHTLKILGIKVSTFNSLYSKSKAIALRTLLDQHLRKLVNPPTPKKDKPEFNPDLIETDLNTIHEAYQYLLKNYVDKCVDESETQFLSLAQIKMNNERRKLRRRSSNGTDVSTGSNTTPSTSGTSSRRSSTVSLKGGRKIKRSRSKHEFRHEFSEFLNF